MNRGTVVLAGRLPIDKFVLSVAVEEFGWSLKEADSLRSLAELHATNNLAAVLFSPYHLNLPWDQAFHSILEAAPSALPILCHGFAEAIDWPEAAEAGAFHSLLLPLSEREVRQSLGFVWRRKAPLDVSVRGRGLRHNTENEDRQRACVQAAVLVA